MNIEKIEINGHYVWIDKDAEIKEGDWFIHTSYGKSKIKKAEKIVGKSIVIDKGESSCWVDYSKKIIAASHELNLEGVPTYVEWLAEQEYKKDPFWIGSGDTARLYDEFKGKRDAFIKGYQAAEKEQQKSLISEVMNEDAKDGLYDEVQLDVEKLAEKEYPIEKGGSMWMPTGLNLNQAYRQEGFIKGCQAAEKELPTWNDVRKAIGLVKPSLNILNNQRNEHR